MNFLATVSLAMRFQVLNTYGPYKKVSVKYIPEVRDFKTRSNNTSMGQRMYRLEKHSDLECQSQ